MPPHAYWTGHVRFSLISVPVRLYTATETKSKVSFNQLHRDTGQRVHNQTVVGDKPIDRSEIVKGYEYEKDRYVTIEPDELKKLRTPTDKTIEVVQFVDAQELDPVYIDRPYYLGPDGRVALEAFAVMREAMNDTGKAAIGRITLSSRESMVALSPRGKGFQLLTLRYAREIRAAEQYFEGIEDVQIDKSKLKLAEQLISGMSKPFDPSEFEDRYEEAVLELIRAKIEGQEPIVATEEEPAPTINFMEALKASLEASGGQEKKPAAKSTRRTKTGGERKRKTG